MDDVYALAKAQFDLKEYLRAAHTLRVRHSTAPDRLPTAAAASRDSCRRGAQASGGDAARFLRCYSLFLAGEKRKNEEVVEVAGPMARITRRCRSAARNN